MTPCTHCGVEMPGAVSTPAFCCGGCRAVHSALNEAGLQGYYDLRARTSDAGRNPAEPAAEPVDALRYGHFDDPGFIERFGSGDGRITLHLDGVHCAACVWVVERVPQVLPGVQMARLDFGRQQVDLRWDPDQVTLSTIAAGLHRLGYPPAPIGAAADRADARARRRDLIRLGVTGALAGNSMMLAGALYAGADGGFGKAFEWLSLLIAIPAVTYGAWPFYRGALSGLRMRMVHLDLPIVIGLLTGFFASLFATITGEGALYYDSGTALVFLLLAGRFAQSRGQRAAMNRAELLCAITPGAAWRFNGTDYESVPASAVRIGDRIRVRTGEGLPADATLLSGQGEVDLQLLTGESQPQPVEPGAQLWAGTVLARGCVEARVEAVGAGTRVGTLLRSATDDARAPLVQKTDALAGRFVTVVLLLAAVGGAVWWWIDPSQALPVVISLLVVTCPCALGLATPVALAVARAQAARTGLLLRSTAALERLASVQRVCIDKTGTLTTGAPEVRAVSMDSQWQPHVAALAARSAHPVSRALAAHWSADGLEVTAVDEVPGRGVSGRVGAHQVDIGAPHRIAVDYAVELRERYAHDGLTPVAICVDGAPVGLIALGDTLRPDAAEAVARLQAMGLSVDVLSGDHPAVVAAAALAIGADSAQGGASPEEKVSVVCQRPTLMVGDGLNDTGALRAAQASIAMRGGADVALQVADVALIDGRLTRVADAVLGARRALAVVRRNLMFSLGYNVIFAGLALAGYVSPLAAAILMPISSLTVIGHSLLSRPFRARDADARHRHPQVTSAPERLGAAPRHAP